MFWVGLAGVYRLLGGFSLIRFAHALYFMNLVKKIVSDAGF